MVSIEDHMNSFLSALSGEGYPGKSIQMYRMPINCLVRYCEEQGKKELDSATVDSFIDFHIKRRDAGLITNGTAPALSNRPLYQSWGAEPPVDAYCTTMGVRYYRG